ncbi:MAG: hypothetical protein ACREVG_06760 [Burkholderiales bacterium]
MRTGRANRERGAALLALLAVIALGASWFLVRQLNAESGGIAAARTNRNAEVLNRAKQALIGYVAAQAAKSGEDRPGALPCPEAPGNFNNAASEGTVSFPCVPPTVGRFPWRTLGLDKLVDASGEPLWYVVAPGWAGANTVINSNCTNTASTLACATGRLSVDGVTNDVIALIIAPGSAFSVAANAAAGCAAWNQARSTVAPPDWRNYLECENATTPADATFVTTGPSGSFNDQVVSITVADLMPAIEGAIAHRIEREIVPILNSAYAAPSWGLAGSDRIFPYAVPFANPETSSFTGSTAASQGFLPVVNTQTTPGSGTLCTPGPANPRCNTAIVGWPNWASTVPSMSYTGVGVTLVSACSYFGQMNWAYCNGTYLGTPTQLTISGSQTGTTALRSVKSVLPTGWVLWLDLTSFAFSISQPTPTSFQIKNDGTLSVSLTVTPPAPIGIAGVMYWLYVPWDVMDDHALLDASTGSATGWFLRNEWHKVLYYATAPGYTAAAAAPRACSDAGVITCLQVSNLPDPTKQRAILVLAGRKLSAQARPGASFADYLDVVENQNGDAIFLKQPVNSSFNDRFVSVSKNP